MNYNSLISDFEIIVNSDLTMENLRKIRTIYLNLVKVYRQEMNKPYNDENKCKQELHNTTTYFNDVLWNTLKSRLDFEDEVINLIFGAIRGMDNIDEIFVIDGNVIVSCSNKNNHSYAVSSKLDFVEVTNRAFYSREDNNQASNLVVAAINSAIKPYVYNKYDPEDVIAIEDGKINYLVDDLKIYVSHDVSSILEDNSGHLITKVLAKYQDKTLYFDLKRRNDCVIVLNDEYNIHTLSEKLSNKKNSK